LLQYFMFPSDYWQLFLFLINNKKWLDYAIHFCCNASQFYSMTFIQPRIILLLPIICVMCFIHCRAY
jgi:hypothetical protein